MWKWRSTASPRKLRNAATPTAPNGSSRSLCESEFCPNVRTVVASDRILDKSDSHHQVQPHRLCWIVSELQAVSFPAWIFNICVIGLIVSHTSVPLNVSNSRNLPQKKYVKRKSHLPLIDYIMCLSFTNEPLARDTSYVHWIGAELFIHNEWRNLVYILKEAAKVFNDMQKQFWWWNQPQVAQEGSC